MPNPIKTLVQDYGWIHLGLGLTGNVLFVAGSVMFLPGLGKVMLPFLHRAMEWKTLGVWFFIVGASLMMVGSLGSLLVSIYDARKSED